MSTEQFTFKRARRAQARLRLALVAPSGAGKTMSALRLAKGIVQFLIDTGQIEGPLEGKIAVIDTERKSASLYAHVCPFDALELEPPYSVDRYQQAIEAAERAGYVICIIDQISHAWAGPGGQLEYVDALKAQARNAMSPWAKVTPMQQEFYDRLLRSPMHIIATMRAKTEYVIEEQIVDGRKKQVPRKIGLSPVQRDGIEYEFTTCLDIELESHTATASKDRTSLFMDRQTRLDEDTGRRIAEWLVSGEKADAAAAEQRSRADAEAAQTRATKTKDLSEGVEDLILSFADCGTVPDLAAQFDKAQKFVRGFAAELGAEAVKPYLDQVVAAKESRKAALAEPGQQARQEGDLLGGGQEAQRLGPDDVGRLEQVARDAGLTIDEAYKELGVKKFADIPLADYAKTAAKLQAAGKTKAAAQNTSTPAPQKRRRAAAGAPA